MKKSVNKILAGLMAVSLLAGCHAQVNLFLISGAAVPLDIWHDNTETQDILIEIIHLPVLFHRQKAGVVTLEFDILRQHHFLLFVTVS